jgi:predicted alpha/beta-fold hydrolase
MRRIVLMAITLGAAAAAPLTASAASPGLQSRFDGVVQQILAEPYQPAYVPVGFDSAFGSANVPNVFPVEDYTSGSRQGSPDAPPWPASFRPVTLTSGDGAPLLGYLALHPGKHPGVVVVHGFNSNAKDSVVRWAAMLYARGYNVIAADQRDFPPEYRAGFGYPNWLQTLGWKEAEDVLAAGRHLAAQPGVTSVGVVGFSLGGQSTVLALAADGRRPAPHRVFAAGLNFSGPADQNTQIYSTAAVPGCETPFCAYPATAALLALVVPPNTYTDPCVVLGDAGSYYGTDAYSILARESAFHAQSDVEVPLLNVYSADDPLVADFQARMMAGYNVGEPLQLTLELEHGLHAYYNDRWWQQRAMLLYLKALLPGAAQDVSIGTTPTVNQTPAGAPTRDQLVHLGFPTRAVADSYLAPYICDTSRPSPGTTTIR